MRLPESGPGGCVWSATGVHHISAEMSPLSLRARSASISAREAEPEYSILSQQYGRVEIRASRTSICGGTVT